MRSNIQPARRLRVSTRIALLISGWHLTSVFETSKLAAFELVIRFCH
jgi:hypothetical protein